MHLIEAKEIPGIKNSTEVKLDSSYITALGLLRVALDTLIGSPDGAGVRGKLTKLLQN